MSAADQEEWPRSTGRLKPTRPHARFPGVAARQQVARLGRSRGGSAGPHPRAVLTGCVAARHAARRRAAQSAPTRRPHRPGHHDDHWMPQTPGDLVTQVRGSLKADPADIRTTLDELLAKQLLVADGAHLRPAEAGRELLAAVGAETALFGLRPCAGIAMRSINRTFSLIMGHMTTKAGPSHRPSTLTIKGRDMRLRTLGFVVVAALVIWFIAANTGSVTIRLWIPTVTVPLWGVLTVTLLVGMALGLFIARRRASR